LGNPRALRAAGTDVIEVDGAEKLAQVARRLKDAGDKDLQRQLYAALNRAMKPVRAATQRSLVDILPKGGGLSAAKSRQVKFRTSRRTGARQAGIRLVAKGGQLGRMDRQGQFRHPVFGHGPWVTQRITPGWFTQPAEAAAPQARQEILQALDDVARELDKP
jgi:hypothetical protein